MTRDSHVVLLREKSLYLDEEFLFDNIRHGLSCPGRDLLHPRVTDQNSFDPDPDPIRIQGFNDKKITVENKIQFFLIKNYNLLIPRPP